MYKSYCSTVHFCRITAIYQPMNAHIISHKTLLKHSDMFRSCQIIIRGLFSLLKLYYNIHNSIRIYKRGVVAAYHVVWECVVEQWLGVRRTAYIKLRIMAPIVYNKMTGEKKWHTVQTKGIAMPSAASFCT